MKKLFALLVILALCGAANAATVSLVDEGTTIAATGGVEYTLEITSTGPLFSLDLLISVSGDATITGAMGQDASDYGWDAGLDSDPIYGTGNVNIGASNFNNAPGPLVAYIKVTYGSGEVVVSIEDSVASIGGSVDGTTYGDIDVSTGTVTLLPEPMTIALLGLGGLFIRRRK